MRWVMLSQIPLYHRAVIGQLCHNSHAFSPTNHAHFPSSHAYCYIVHAPYYNIHSFCSTDHAHNTTDRTLCSTDHASSLSGHVSNHDHVSSFDNAPNPTDHASGTGRTPSVDHAPDPTDFTLCPTDHTSVRTSSEREDAVLKVLNTADSSLLRQYGLSQVRAAATLRRRRQRAFISADELLEIGSFSEKTVRSFLENVINDRRSAPASSAQAVFSPRFTSKQLQRISSCVGIAFESDRTLHFMKMSLNPPTTIDITQPSDTSLQISEVKTIELELPYSVLEASAARASQMRDAVCGLPVVDCYLVLDRGAVVGVGGTDMTRGRDPASVVRSAKLTASVTALTCSLLMTLPQEAQIAMCAQTRLAKHQLLVRSNGEDGQRLDLNSVNMLQLMVSTFAHIKRAASSI